MNQVGAVLLVNVLEFAVVVGSSQVIEDLISGTCKEEVVCVFGDAGLVERAISTFATVSQAFVVGRVTMVCTIDIAAVQSQSCNFLGDNLCALEGLRQQARVASGNSHVLRFKCTDFQNGLGDFEFCSQTKGGVIIRCTRCASW